MGAISILGVGHCPMQRFLNSELREMECAERRVSLPDVCCRARAEAVERMV